MEIDVNLGKLPQKEKGSLEIIECKTIEEKRRHGLERLASGFRTFSHFGFDEGVAGHITFRDPEFEHHFWVNPFGMHFGQICVSDLVLVDRNGEVVIGDRPVNTAAFAIHSRLHEARPDVNAAAHSHSMYDEGDRIANALGDKRAAILKNHGLLTTGETVDAAVWGFLSMDRCCQSQMIAESVGQMERIPDETAAMTKEQVGSELGMWVMYQPIYDLMLEKDDSFLN